MADCVVHCVYYCFLISVLYQRSMELWCVDCYGNVLQCQKSREENSFNDLPEQKTISLQQFLEILELSGQK
ncbi:hypothetical protein QUC31_008767 [Theobroma cacao]